MRLSSGPEHSLLTNRPVIVNSQAGYDAVCVQAGSAVTCMASVKSQNADLNMAVLLPIALLRPNFALSGAR